MKVAIFDFELASKSYKPYTEGVSNLQKIIEDHHNKLDELQKEAQKLADSSKSIVLDEESSKINMEKLQQIQQEAMLRDKNIKKQSDAEQRRLIMLAYDNLSDIVKKYSEENEIDVVFNRSEIVFYKEELDITNIIINLIKEK